MKKFLSLLLCLAMALSLAACGGGGQPANDSVPPSEPAQNESTPPVEEPTAPTAEFTPVSAGEAITTDDYEFTLNAVEFSYEVLPADTTGYYSYYSPESGNVYIHVDATVKNLMKRDIQIGEIMTAEAVYGDGYSYKGFAVVEDGSSFNFASSWSAAAPLQSCNAHYLIECPDEVETSSDPLVGIKLPDGITYLYTVR